MSEAIEVHVVCAAGMYENADGKCGACASDFEFPPLCESDGTTLRTLDLASNPFAEMGALALSDAVADGFPPLSSLDISGG